MIRAFEERDWPAVRTVIDEVASRARPAVLGQSLGLEIGGTVPGAFRRPSGGYVGLHVMYLDLASR